MLMKEDDEQPSSNQMEPSDNTTSVVAGSPAVPETEGGLGAVAAPTATPPEIPNNKRIVVAELFSTDQIVNILDVFGTPLSFKVVNNAGTCLTLKLIEEAI